ncbi:MAG: tRNA CCA-pyrophosphorylase [Syntrophobacterales bacterium]|nr:MAG: tRNA CCA-pyrophosphorylase [Syntrophobacterales bacterium]
MNKKDSSVEDTLCGRPIERVLEETTNFHGFPAPGVVIGAVMVDLAREQIGPGIEADAIVETLRCLPDAVQLFTACTLGNGWMRVLDWDRFALTLYDRATRRGCRVWLDAAKTAAHPTIHDWFLKRVPKNALPLETLLGKILEARRAVLSCRSVIVTDFLRRPKKEAVAICPGCGEAFDPRAGDCCKGCLHGKYFKMDGA